MHAHFQDNQNLAMHGIISLRVQTGHGVTGHEARTGASQIKAE